jgi:hypothetical protein
VNKIIGESKDNPTSTETKETQKSLTEIIQEEVDIKNQSK